MARLLVNRDLLLGEESLARRWTVSSGLCRWCDEGKIG